MEQLFNNLQTLQVNFYCCSTTGSKKGQEFPSSLLSKWGTWDRRDKMYLDNKNELVSVDWNIQRNM